MRSRQRHLWLTILIVSGIGIAFQPRRGQDTPRVWTKEYLVQALTQIGYKAVWVGPEDHNSYTQGLYVARQTDPRSWGEITSRRPKNLPDKYWCGLVLIQRDVFNTEPPLVFVQSEPNEIRARGLVFYGDPTELVRIAAHLQP